MKLIILFVGILIINITAGQTSSLNDTLGDDEAECRDYHSLKNESDICQFVNITDDCKMDGGFINYLMFGLCKVEPRFLPAVYVLYGFWLLFLFIALGTTAESFFCPALEFIAHNLKLSHNIAGITVVAFGNGAPDIFSALAAFKNSTPGSTGVAIGALLGAGVFVTTVVAGAVSITRPFQMAQRPFLRDLTFYLATVFWTFCLLYNGQINLYNSIGFLLLYVVYVIVVLVGRSVNQWMRRRKNSLISDANYNERSPLLEEPPPVLEQTDENGDWIDQPLRAGNEYERDLQEESHQAVNEASASGDGESSSEDDDDVDNDLDGSKWHRARRNVWSRIRPIHFRKWRETSLLAKIIEICQSPIMLLCNLTVPVISAEGGAKDWSRTLTCIHCVLTPLFCVFGAKGGSVYIGGVMPVWALLLMIGVIAAVLVWFISEENTRPKYYWIFAYIGFVSSIIWTYSIANEIVNLLRTLGALLNVSNVIMGLTLLAWGNSIGDMVADVTLAKQGYPRMAISACFGGPFFNLIVGIGLPCTIATITSGQPLIVKFTTVEAMLAGSLLFSLCFSFIIIPLRSFNMTKLYGVILIIIYVVYLPIVLLSGVGIIN